MSEIIKSPPTSQHVRALHPNLVLLRQLQMLGIATLVLLVAFMTPTAARILPVVLAILAGLFLYVRRGFRLFSPSWVAFLGLSGSAILGTMFWPALHGKEGVSANIQLTDQLDALSWSSLLLAAAALAFGAALASTGRRAAADRSISGIASRTSARTIRILAVTPAVMTMLVAGSGLWSRGNYLFLAPGSVASIVTGTLTIPGAVASGWLIGARRSAKNRLYGWATAFMYAAIFFGLASRRLGILPLLLLAGYGLAGQGARIRVVHVVLGVALSLFLFQFVIGLRSLESHGIANYSRDGGEVFIETLTNLSMAPFANILFSYPLTGYVASVPDTIPAEHLWVSLDPRSGGSVGWYDMAPTLRVNFYTPYNSVGELAAHGTMTLILYFSVAGAVIGALDALSRTASGAGRLMFTLIPVALSSLFTFSVLQYNLRSSTRLLYLILATTVFLGALILMSSARPNSRPPDDAPAET